MEDLELNPEKRSQLAAGDKAAWESTTRIYLKNLSWIPRGISPSDLEEVFQLTFMNAWQYKASYDPNRPFLLWIKAIARNVYRTMVKKRESERAAEERAQSLKKEESADSSCDIENLRQMLNLCLSQIDEACRKLLDLHLREKLSRIKKAEQLSITPGQFGGRYRTCLKRLRKLILVNFQERS